jgi:hypothetical protein
MALRHRRPLTIDVIRLCTGTIPVSAGPAVSLGTTVGLLVDVRCDADLLAFARNSMLRESLSDWVVFVDESVELGRRWMERLERDLDAVDGIDLIACSLPSTTTSNGRHIAVPGLDVAYRRSVLDDAGPFEAPSTDGWTTDDEMQLRLTSMGFVVQRGERAVR